MGIKTRDNNVGKLKNQHKNLKDEQKTKVYSLIDLYGKGNIHNINTLRYEINKLLTPSDNKSQNELAYFKTMVKYLEPSKHQKIRHNANAKYNLNKKRKLKKTIHKYSK